MTRKLPALLALVMAAPLAAACASDGTQGGDAQPSRLGQAASAVGGAASAVRNAAPSVPNLVNVDLRNVLNDLAVRLNIDRSNVPINIQLPINLAVNVCGVSVNVLSVSAAAPAQCTATNAPQELAQVVQQQMAGGGSVGGGAQGGSTAANSGSAPTSGAATGGAANANATSTGSTETTTTTPAPQTAPATQTTTPQTTTTPPQ